MGLLILDEVFAALNRGFVTVEELAGLLTGRPPGVNLILTGRGCPPELYPLADCVSEIQPGQAPPGGRPPGPAGVEF